MIDLNKIYLGDSLTILKSWPDNFVDCCITSPPYWALRDYGVSGQLGLEPTFQEYITKLCDIFDEVKRVLKKEGTCWVVIGDTYSGSGGNHKEWHKNDTGFQGKVGVRCGGVGSKRLKKQWLDPKYPHKEKLRAREHINNGQVESKSLCQIPSRFAIEMCNRGWILRNEIIWEKPNCMPSSVTDRFTVNWESVFFFVKSKKYYFEQQFEPYVENTDMAYRGKIRAGRKYGVKRPYEDNQPLSHSKTPAIVNPEGKNKRSVWTINTKPFKEAHFAVFPEKLVEPMVKAGCPQFVCNKCGKSRNSIYDKKLIVDRYTNDKGKVKEVLESGDKRNVLPRARTGVEGHNEFTFKGYTDCGCKSGFSGGIVLDPFAGAGTTALVARNLGRQFLGIELNPSYIDIINKRLAQQILI